MFWSFHKKSCVTIFWIQLLIYKKWKKSFLEKMTFFHVFKEFLDDYFLYKKQILIMWIIREWRVNVIHNILFSNLCLHIDQHIFIFSQHYSTSGQHLILSAVLESTSPPLRTTFLKKKGGEVETQISHPKNTSKKSAFAAGFIKLKTSLHFLNKLMAHNFWNDIYWSLSYHVPYFSSVVHVPSIIIDSLSTKQWYYALIVT